MQLCSELQEKYYAAEPDSKAAESAETALSSEASSKDETVKDVDNAKDGEQANEENTRRLSSSFANSPSFAISPSSAKESDTAGSSRPAFRRFTGSELAEFDKRLDVAVAVAHLLGLPAVEGERGSWTVGKTTLTLELWREPDRGFYVWRIRGERPTFLKRRSLAHHEVFAASVTGRLLIEDSDGLLRRRERPELVRWRSRMLVELGVIAPAPVALPALDGSAPVDAIATREVVERLLGTRWVTEPMDEPFTFSAPWIAGSYHIDANTIRRGKTWMERHGYLERVGTTRGHPIPAILWRARDPRTGRFIGGGERERPDTRETGGEQPETTP